MLVWVADADGAVTMVSDAWLEFTGTRLEDNLGAGWLALVHPEDRERVRAAWAERDAEPEPFQVEYRLRRHDARWRWVLSRGRASALKGVPGIVWVGDCVDLHEQAEADEESQLLVEVSRRVAVAEDLEADLDAVVALAVPVVGDACGVTLTAADLPAQATILDRLPPGLRDLLDDPGGQALVVPLVARGRRLGAFVAATTPERPLGARELRVATALALRLAPVLDSGALLRQTRRTGRDSEELRALLDAFVIDAPVGLAFYDTELRYLRINELLAEANGLPVEDHLGRTPSEVLAPELAAALEAILGEVLRTGQARRELPITTDYARDGGARHWIVSFYPVRLQDGEIVGIGVLALDVTGRHRDEQVRQELLERATLLARAGGVLDSDLSLDATLQALAELAIAELATWCSVELVEDDGSIRVAAIAHADPELAAEARRYREAYPLDPDGPSPSATVIRTGEPELLPELPEELLLASTSGPDQLEALKRLRMRSAVVVPLVARGRTLGALTLVHGDERTFGPHDLSLAVDLGRRAGLSLDNARLYEEARASQLASDEARALLDTIIQQAPVGIGVFDTDLRYVRVNRALAEINGLSPAAHIGRRPDELLPGLERSVEAALRQVLVTGEPMVDLEVAGRLPGDPDARRQFLVSYYRIRVDGGQTLGLAATVVDVTSRRADEQALRDQRDLYETLLRAQSELGAGFALVEGSRVLYVNEAAERITGRSAAELYALEDFLDLAVADRRGEVLQRIAVLRGDGDAQPGFETELRRPSGARVAIEVAAKRLATEGGDRLIILLRDIAGRKREERERDRLLEAERRARQETEAAHRRARFLADVSGTLERSLELRDVLGQVAAQMAGEVCDIASIFVLTRDRRRLERLGSAAADPARDALARRAVGRSVGADAGNGLARVALTGQPSFHLRLHEDDLRSWARDDEDLARMTALVGRSATLLPLIARGESVGCVALGWDAAEHLPENIERRHLEELCRRLALAIDNAQLYAERAHIASTLQASLLPPGLPAMAGLEVAARYLPAGEATEVGGDFYDLFGSDAEGWSVVVGDVCGKGAEAAAVTAMARYTLRAAPVAGAQAPAQALGLLNASMAAERVAERFLTAALARVVRHPAGASVTLACAGHPSPVVLHADGRAASSVGARGPLLGIDTAATWREQSLELGPGDTLVFYTDGVTEARRREPLSADDLATLLAPEAGASADGAAEAIRAIARARAAGPLRDDVAIVALRVAEG